MVGGVDILGGVLLGWVVWMHAAHRLGVAHGDRESATGAIAGV